MMKINNRLKKMCGEKLAQYLIRNFSQDKLLAALPCLFYNSGKDVKRVKESDWQILKTIINNYFEKQEEEADNAEKAYPTPETLLAQRGYTLHRSESHEDILSYRHYFAAGEELCKFSDGNRHQNYHVFWIVKDNAKDIKRGESPDRQDEYSTSVCSIQISKDGQNVTQITSRYNHSVSACDNTFSSDLNNIASDLTQSFNQHFGFDLQKGSGPELTNFVVRAEKYAYYKKEINGVLFGDNTIIGSEVEEYCTTKYYIYDYFLIDLQKKKIIWDEQMMGYLDGFVTHFNSVVEKIVFVKDIDEVDDGNDDTVCYIQKG